MSDRNKNREAATYPKESLQEDNKNEKSVNEDEHHDDMNDNEYVGYHEERRKSLENAFKHTMDLFD